MSSLCIITARGGSKRIPKKNIKEFCGQPIIACSIRAALDSKLFDEVMVSTDSEEIADIARKFGAAIPFMRSERNSDDHSTTADVLLEVVASYRSCGKEFDYICCIYPTAPFVTAGKLRQAFEKMGSQRADAIIPVVKFSFPPQRCFIKKDGRILYKWPEYMFTRSQDLEPYYHDAGQFYFIKTSVLESDKTLVPVNTISLEMDEMEVQDIDNITDWKLAELKYQFMVKKK